MTQTLTHTTEHEITVNAPAAEIYRLLADAESWPQIFPPTIHVEQLSQDGDTERIQIWAMANDDVKTWTSRRWFDPVAQRIGFRQEVSTPPIAAMGGTWIITAVNSHVSRIVLLHDFEPVDDDPASLEWINTAVDRNSRVELAALKGNLESQLGADACPVITFEDTVEIAGSAISVFNFLNEANLWQERLPHVARVNLTETTPGLQTLEMDTLTKDGSTHTTTSVRVCLPDRLIAYKQTGLPALLSLHTGTWRLSETAGVTTATSAHSVMLNHDNISTVLGPEATPVTAEAFIRNALSTNSRATLGYAKAFAERPH